MISEIVSAFWKSTPVISPCTSSVYNCFGLTIDWLKMYQAEPEILSFLFHVSLLSKHSTYTDNTSPPPTVWFSRLDFFHTLLPKICKQTLMCVNFRHAFFNSLTKDDFTAATCELNVVSQHYAGTSFPNLWDPVQKIPVRSRLDHSLGVLQKK